MSEIRTCTRCGKYVIYPGYPGDGAYPVEPMCRCPENQPNPKRVPRTPSPQEV